MNTVGDHVHALIVIGAGAIASWHGHQDLGTLLITTGGVMWRGKQ